jgi:hypothetical protein
MADLGIPTQILHRYRIQDLLLGPQFHHGTLQRVLPEKT